MATRGGFIKRSSFLLLLALVPAPVNAGRAAAVCPAGSSPGFFVVDNTVLLTEESVVLKDFSEEECQKTCSTNADPNGKPILCSSFAYDHVSFACTIFASKGKPQGDAATKHAVGKRYFEKFCLPADVATTCEGAQFIRADDSVLVGYAANVTLVETLEECVAQCVKEKSCQSAMFFFEEGECITNTESALSKPSSFAREDTEKVIYFQNGCLAKSAIAAAEGKASGTPLPVVDGAKSEFDDSHSLPASAELPVSTSVEIEDDVEEKEFLEEEPLKKTSKSTTTSTAAPTTSTTQEPTYDDSEEDLVEDDVTTTALPTTKRTKRPRKEKEQKPDEITKYKKHPRNFGSKTVHYKHKKSEKKDEKLKIDQNEISEQPHTEEEVDAASEETEKVEGAESSKPAAPSDPYTAFFSDWSDWTPCHRSGERRIRRRKCLDLRRCLGALMQVENCPAVMPKLIEQPHAGNGGIESIRSVVGAPLEGDPLAGIDAEATTPSIHEGDIAAADSPAGDGFIWSPWLGTCQKFASGQPCNDGLMIGFESRECVAKDPSKCEGPFFRYCTLPC